MKSFILLALLILSLSADETIFDFKKDSDLEAWRVVDDVVMGGRSAGSLTLSPEGHGLFKGYVSLENNGGFSSIRCRFDRKSVQGYGTIVLRVKGDGKKYQFRIKDRTSDYYSYIASFSTTEEWQAIEIPLSAMEPSFRGRKLDIPNFSSDGIEEIAILIGNKSEEAFELLIDKIEMK